MEQLRREVSEEFGRTLPFDDDVLRYLVRAAATTESREFSELVGEFCPSWPAREQAALVRTLVAHETKGSRAPAQPQKAVSSGNKKLEQPRQQVQALAAALHGEDLAAQDLLLAQMLQEDAQASAELDQGRAHARSSGKQKKGYRPLNISYNVAHNGVAASVGTTGSTSLADIIQNRRANNRPQINVPPEMFGPPATRGGQPQRDGGWQGPEDFIANTGGISWAERARIAAETSAAHEPPAPTPAPAPPIKQAPPIVPRAQAPSAEERGRRPPAPQAQVPDRWDEAQESDGPMTLNIALPGGVTDTMESVAPTSTVQALKRRISQEHGIRAEHLTLYFFGMKLENEWVLADSGIAHRGTIRVELRPPTLSTGASDGSPAAPGLAPRSNIIAPVKEAEPGPSLMEASLRAGRASAKQSAKAKKKKAKDDRELASFQSSEHGRILSEEEAMEMVLALSRETATAQEAIKQFDDYNEDEDIVAEPTDCPPEGTEFFASVAVQEDRFSLALASAKEITSSYGAEDFISKVSKRSGLRLCMLVSKRGSEKRAPKTVLAYAVYRFRQTVLSIVQAFVADGHRGSGYGCAFLRLLEDHASKSKMDVVALSCPKPCCAFFDRLGYRLSDSTRQTLLADDRPEGEVLMEKNSPRANKAEASKPRAKSGSASAPSAAQGSGAARSTPRSELIESIFWHCDVNGDGRLNCQEMLTFARHTGFDGSDAEWAEEYALLCKDNATLPAVGVDCKLLARLADDDSDQGCYCTDEDLRTMLQELQAASAASRKSTAATAPRQAPAHTPVAEATSRKAAVELSEATLDRRGLVEGVFKACDADHDGRLRQGEMYTFASRIGFDGSETEWASEYATLCSEHRLGSEGIDLNLFMKLVDDESDSGCYCDTDELRTMLDALTSKSQATSSTALNPPETSQATRIASPSNAPETAKKVAVELSQATLERRSLAQSLFKACDADGDGRLCQSEMHTFASQQGFDGSETEWASEYAILCSEHGLAISEGIDLDLFMKLVDDESDSGCYCDTDELRTMLDALSSKSQRPAATTLVEPAAMVTPGGPGSSNETREPSTLTQQATTAPENQFAGTYPASTARPSFQPERRDSAAQETSVTKAGVERLTVVNREGLARAVFKACDADDDGRLCMAEMYAFASRAGFDGGEADWLNEYAILCSENDLMIQGGVDVDLFLKLIDDESDSGCFCTDEELREIVSDLFSNVLARWNTSAAPAQRKGVPPRSALVGAVFRACDVDGDGALNAKEMWRFASLVGFGSGEAAWQAEFTAILREQGEEADALIRPELFASLLDDPSEKGCFCTDDELRRIIARLEADRRMVLMSKLFAVLDRDSDGWLTREDFRLLASCLQGSGNELHVSSGGRASYLDNIFEQACRGSLALDAFLQLAEGTLLGGFPRLPDEALQEALQSCQQRLTEGGLPGLQATAANEGPRSYRPPPGLELPS